MMMKTKTLLIASIVCGSLISSAAQAILLTFEGLGDNTPVGSFYNTAPQDFDLVFSSNAIALIDSDAGGTGNFGGEPSPNTVITLSGTSPSVTIDSLAGFGTSFSLYYSAVNTGGSFAVYSGAGHTGSVLASLNLAPTGSTPTPGDPGLYSPFVPVGVLFSGTARSVGLVGTENQILFDDLNFGARPTAVPEPGTLVLLGGGLLLLGIFGISRRKISNKGNSLVQPSSIRSTSSRI